MLDCAVCARVRLRESFPLQDTRTDDGQKKAAGAFFAAQFSQLGVLSSVLLGSAFALQQLPQSRPIWVGAIASRPIAFAESR